MKKLLLVMVCVGIFVAGEVAAAHTSGFVGKIKNFNGDPVEQATVLFMNGTENAYELFRTTSDVNGNFELDLPCSDNGKQPFQKLTLTVWSPEYGRYSYDFVPQEVCDQLEPVKLLDIVVEGSFHDLEEVTATSKARLPLMGCFVQGTYDYDTFLTAENQKKWEDFKNKYELSAIDFFYNKDSKIFQVKAANQARADTLKSALEKISIGISGLHPMQECSSGAASQVAGISFKPRYQAGVGGTHALQGDATDITYWLQTFGKKIAGAMAAIAVFFVVWNAFNMLLAQGDADEISKAKKAITWIVFGLLLTVFAYVIVKTVISLTYLW